MPRKRIELPCDASVELATLEYLTRIIIRRLDEMARRADWLKVNLFEIYTRNNAIPEDSIKGRIREVNNKIYELDAYFPFSPVCELFPAETPTPTEENPNQDNPSN